jgi:hypothetical protein
VQRRFDPSPFPSFTVVLAAPSGALLSRWRLDGTWEHEDLPAGWHLVTSSAWRTDEVCTWRAERFDAWRSDGAPMEGALPTYNLLEVPGRAEWSPLMSRPWSATRSITRVASIPKDRRVSMAYWRRTDSGIDAHGPDATVDLPLRFPVDTP